MSKRIRYRSRIFHDTKSALGKPARRTRYWILLHHKHIDEQAKIAQSAQSKRLRRASMALWVACERGIAFPAVSGAYATMENARDHQ